jgi:hypothetical protein
MRSPSDNSDSVQKLLRLKRYEQPPPRYFNEFSGKVIARIERGEGRASWWERFGFDLRPALAAVTGAFACGLVVYGVATADDVPPAEMNGMQSFSAAPAGAGSVDLGAGAELASGNSTNPVSSYGTPIDRNVFRAQFTPVSYQLR